MADKEESYKVRFSDIQLPISAGNTTNLSRIKCEICKKEVSKYTCPKCTARYCGVTCYKSESHLACSENFYREHVMAELHTKKASAKEKMKMMEVLKRLNREDAAKPRAEEKGIKEKGETITARMEGLDLNEAGFEEIWARLCEDEKKIFEELLNEGDIELDQLCKPWWLGLNVFNRENKIIEMEKTADEKDVAPLPEMIKDLPSLKMLLPNKDPSPLMVYNVSEVIAIYAFVYRLYNSEMDDSVIEALDTIISLSRVLQSNHSYSDLKSCLNSFVQSIKGNSLYCDTIDPIEVSLTDYCSIVNSEADIGASTKVSSSLLCISDLHKLFSAGIEAIKSQKKRVNIDKEKKQKYLQIKRKLYFMSAWLQENHESISELKENALRLKIKLDGYWKNIKHETELFEKHSETLRMKNKSKLIQELT